MIQRVVVDRLDLLYNKAVQSFTEFPSQTVRQDRR